MALVPMSAQSAERLQEKRDQQRASVCEGCRSMPPLTYIMCHLAFGGLPLAASLDAVSAIQSELMPAFSET
jgi:hypothetical protein